MKAVKVITQGTDSYRDVAWAVRFRRNAFTHERDTTDYLSDHTNEGCEMFNWMRDLLTAQLEEEAE